MSASDDETYTIPIKDQRYFGAGLKRTRVKFVPASSPATTHPSASGSAVSDLYLSIVGGSGSGSSSSSKAESRRKDGSSSGQGHAQSTPEICGLCNLPLTSSHIRSLAHQVHLEHSHPPSAIERSRKGLSFLQAHGWDPNSRKGLGKAGEGILHPIKVKEKNNTVGLGMHVPKNVAPKSKVEKLNAKEVRKHEEQDKRRKEQLQRLFYSNDDVLFHLGEG